MSYKSSFITVKEHEKMQRAIEIAEKKKEKAELFEKKKKE